MRRSLDQRVTFEIQPYSRGPWPVPFLCYTLLVILYILLKEVKMTPNLYPINEEDELDPELKFDDDSQYCSPSDKPLPNCDEEGMEYLFES